MIQTLILWVKSASKTIKTKIFKNIGMDPKIGLKFVLIVGHWSVDLVVYVSTPIFFIGYYSQIHGEEQYQVDRYRSMIESWRMSLIKCLNKSKFLNRAFSN